MINQFIILAKLSFLHLGLLFFINKNGDLSLPQKPIITCNDIIIAANPNPMNPFGGCQGKVALKASAVKSGDCINGEVLYWDVLIDKDGDGIMDIEYSSHLPRTDKNISDDTNNNGLPDAFITPTFNSQWLVIPEFEAAMTENNHKVTWTVTDGCNHSSTCTSAYTIKDKKAPTPYCVSLSNALLQNGKAELFAIDLDKGSFDNCTPQSELLYTFNNERPVLSKINEEHYFKGLGIGATKEEYNTGLAQKWWPQYRSSSWLFTFSAVLDISMSVWDKAFNTDFCKVTFTISEPEYLSMAGQITTRSLKPIEKVKVVVEANVAEFPQSGIFDGNYFFGTRERDDYMIKPSKSDDYHNGINTLDLAVLQRHLSGKKKLTSPEQLIAADINGDSKIDNSDYLELKRLVLGMTDSFSQNNSWIFIPKSYVFSDPNHPFSAPRFIAVYLVKNVDDLDFIGIKIGDLDGSVGTMD